MCIEVVPSRYIEDHKKKAASFFWHITMGYSFGHENRYGRGHMIHFVPQGNFSLQFFLLFRKEDVKFICVVDMLIDVRHKIGWYMFYSPYRNPDGSFPEVSVPAQGPSRDSLIMIAACTVAP